MLLRRVNKMKSLIIYYSYYNSNTEKIAKIFADSIDAELFNLKESKNININIDNYDLIGFGSGVYNENLSPILFKAVEGLSLEGKKVFVFSTSCVGFKLYNKKMIKILTSKGAICKGSFACKGSFVYSDNKIFELLSKRSVGHPNEDDIINAKNFIENIVN